MPAKKVSGINRHLAVDTQGLPPGIFVTTANITDRQDALSLFSDEEKKQKIEYDDKRE